jgi:ABC-type multidrug transport system ATPase subunit
MTDAITVRNLVKNYDSRRPPAVQGISFEVKEGCSRINAE